MAKGATTSFFADFASEVASRIDSIMARRDVSAGMPAKKFFASAEDNCIYVLYSASGVPLALGAIVTSTTAEERDARDLSIASLAASGAVDSVRALRLDTEDLALRVLQWLGDLFGNALALGGAPPRKRGRRPGPKPVQPRVGRPRKVSAAKGRPGRRKKGASDLEASDAPRRGPGRPRKGESVTGETKVKRGPGRPRKNPDASTARRRGRPRKADASSAKRGPGRPRKNPIESAKKQKPRRRGRPKKTGTEIAGATAPARRRGRPPKSSST